MKRDTSLAILKSSFLSCEKDAETIIKKLFVTSKPYCDTLKRLLVINTKDCLDESNKNYQQIIDKTTVKDLIQENYVTLVPKVKLKEHEEIKSYIVISFDNFLPTSNPEYRDHTITFDILCHSDYWDIGDYRVRPLKIAGFIDGILNKTKLSGIGYLDFLSMQELVLDENLSGYTLMFKVTNGNDDTLEE